VRNYAAIWDTGATGTVIPEKVVFECGLKPIGMTKACGVDGEYNTEVYLINVTLPNGLCFSPVRATKGKLLHDFILIGMDIITQGDFAVTNYQGKTCFTFRCPSQQVIDFTGAAPKQPGSVPVVARNSPCPCGSGKKYKRCCGK
jgi:predicted aspartyl protease